MNFILSSCHCACALGRDNAEVFDNYRRGTAPGMRMLDGDVPSRSLRFGLVPGELPRIDEAEWAMRTNRLLALSAAALREDFAALVARYGRSRVGVVLGASNTGVDEAQVHITEWLDASAGGAAPKPAGLDFSMIELGTPAEYLRRLVGVEGPAYTVSTACSSSGKAFAAARRLIETGVVDAVITGGVDGRCRFAMNGFHALGALAAAECRPLSPDRDGINLGEGVALFTLERGRSGVALAGVGETSDAYHPTAPDPSGAGAERAMRLAMAAAGWTAADVDYVNLHGTGTVANDAMELKACAAVFGTPEIGGDLSAARPLLESTKALTGHCLGAAGAVEAALCWLRLRSGDSVRALSNSFAFGGSNVSVALERR